MIRPFTLAVPQAELADLRTRLLRARWPEPETDPSQGVPLAELQKLCEYWASDYDWRRCETRLNDIGQFTTEIDGLDIHFLHVRSPHPGALPLLLTHGWPGSVIEFLEVIGPLTDPPAHGGSASDAFDVVIPSLPGYGFSGKPTAPGWNTGRIAAAWAVLMARLGYDRYVAQGGDWGSIVTVDLAAADPSHVAGIHLNMPVVFPDPADTPTEIEQRQIKAFARFQRHGTGYQALQSTRPQTIGYGLVDSPVALAGWIVEKLREWSDDQSALTFDKLLDNLMLYWLPATGASAARLYWESLRNLTFPELAVPVGISAYPKELFQTSERWARKRFPTLDYWHEVPVGGHFAAFEQPESFVREVTACFAAIR